MYKLITGIYIIAYCIIMFMAVTTLMIGIVYLNDWHKKIQARKNTKNLRRINAMIIDNKIASAQVEAKLKNLKP